MTVLSLRRSGRRTDLSRFPPYLPSPFPSRRVRSKSAVLGNTTTRKNKWLCGANPVRLPAFFAVLRHFFDLSRPLTRRSIRAGTAQGSVQPVWSLACHIRVLYSRHGLQTNSTGRKKKKTKKKRELEREYFGPPRVASEGAREAVVALSCA